MAFWSRKKSVPDLLPSNPGTSVSGKVGFSNAQRSWGEQYNVVTLLASVLRDRGDTVEQEDSWLVHTASGFVLMPRLVELRPLQNGGAQTTATIQVHHPALVPGGVFEYQHSTGDSVEASLRQGFDQWAQMDFVALLDALQPKPENCTTLRLAFPAKNGRPAYTRRAVLGPITHYAKKPEIYESPPAINSAGEKCEIHEFCPCCLLTKSFDTFKVLLEGSAFYGIRLFASRDAEGVAMADCRVNGEDWQKGAEALQKYVATWPDAGFEFRKQYVVLQTVGNDSST